MYKRMNESKNPGRYLTSLIEMKVILNCYEMGEK